MLSKESNVESDSTEMNLNGSLFLHQDGPYNLLLPSIVLENDFSKRDNAIYLSKCLPNTCESFPSIENFLEIK
jgi:hypothetical protein